MKMHSNLWLSLAAALLAVSLLPLPALASENVVESAPQLTLPAESPEPDRTLSRADAAYLPLKQIIPARGTVSGEEQLFFPQLTDAELKRAQELLAATETGQEIPSAGTAPANGSGTASVSVYPLNPDDFDGETFYVILPSCPLDDGMLQSLISSFGRLGIPFDPDALNFRNCSRGVSYGSSTRTLSMEENERLQTIRRLIHRGILTRETVPQETNCLISWTEWTGQTFDFCLYPYRSMTDDELAALAFARDTVWEADPDSVEMNARKFARSMMNLPLSMTAATESAHACGATEYENGFEFIYADGKSGRTALAERTEPVSLTVWHTEEPGKAPDLFRMSVWYVWGVEVADEHSGYTDADWISAAGQWAADNLLLPKDQLPDSWTVISKNAGTILLTAGTQDWQFELGLNISDTFTEYFTLTPVDKEQDQDVPGEP